MTDGKELPAAPSEVLPAVTIEGRQARLLWSENPGRSGLPESRAATGSDFATVLAALPVAARGPLLAELVKQGGNWEEIDEAADAEAQKVLDMTDEELRTEIAASVEHPERIYRWSRAAGKWIVALADATKRATAAEAALAEALKWSDDDQPIPEDAAIKAAHPVRSGSHDAYAEAMRMVGAKRSKGALVDLANWLLGRVEKAEESYRFMVERAADQKPDGYRELGQRAANAERQRDEERSLREGAERELAIAVRRVDFLRDALGSISGSAPQEDLEDEDLRDRITSDQGVAETALMDDDVVSNGDAWDGDPLPPPEAPKGEACSLCGGSGERERPGWGPETCNRCKGSGLSTAGGKDER